MPGPPVPDPMEFCDLDGRWTQRGMAQETRGAANSA